MASRAEIGNRALIKLGQPRVSNFETDESVNAVTINALWSSVRDIVLQTYPWNFSVKRANIAASAEAPSWGYSYKFPIPSDCLQILEIRDDVEYQAEDNHILCDESGPIYIKYISNSTDVDSWPPTFNELFIAHLAIEASERITDDTGLKQLLMQQLRMVEEKVMATDSVENWPVDPVEDDWIKVRY